MILGKQMAYFQNHYGINWVNQVFIIDIPEKYGGQGADPELAMSVPSAITYENYGSVSVGMSVHSDIVAHYILNLVQRNKNKPICPRWHQEITLVLLQ